MKGIITKLIGGELKQEGVPTPDYPVPIEHKAEILVIKVNEKEMTIPVNDIKIKRIYKHRNHWYVEFDE